MSVMDGYLTQLEDFFVETAESDELVRLMREERDYLLAVADEDRLQPEEADRLSDLFTELLVRVAEVCARAMTPERCRVRLN